MTPEQIERKANRVWDILVDECGASNSYRDIFVHHFPTLTEFRFGGRLGFGGKLYAGSPLRVGMYREDETPATLEMQKRANQRLRTLERGYDRLRGDTSSLQTRNTDWRPGTNRHGIPEPFDEPSILDEIETALNILLGDRRVVVSVRWTLLDELDFYAADEENGGWRAGCRVNLDAIMLVPGGRRVNFWLLIFKHLLHTLDHGCED